MDIKGKPDTKPYIKKHSDILAKPLTLFLEKPGVYRKSPTKELYCIGEVMGAGGGTETFIIKHTEDKDNE